jgi:hypothetical protein
MKNVFKPDKPLRRIKDVAWRVCRWHFTEERFNEKFDLQKSFPCYKCAGKGHLRDYSGVGNDYSEETCTFCLDGRISKEEFQKYHNELIKSYESSLKEYNDVKDRLSAILKKITKKEAEFISRYY